MTPPSNLKYMKCVFPSGQFRTSFIMDDDTFFISSGVNLSCTLRVTSSIHSLLKYLNLVSDKVLPPLGDVCKSKNMAGVIHSCLTTCIGNVIFGFVYMSYRSYTFTTDTSRYKHYVFCLHIMSKVGYYV